MGIFDEDDFFEDGIEEDAGVQAWRAERDRSADAEFEPYTPKHKPRALPIATARWAGRGTRGILPYASFDSAALHEAVAIINGTSKFYSFNEKGALQSLMPNGQNMETFLQHMARRNELLALSGKDNSRRVRTLEKRITDLDNQLNHAREERAQASNGFFPMQKQGREAEIRRYQIIKDDMNTIDDRGRALHSLPDNERNSPAVAEEFKQLNARAAALYSIPLDVSEEFQANYQRLETAVTHAETRVETLRKNIEKTKAELENRKVIEDGTHFESLKREFLGLMNLGENNALSDTDRKKRWALADRLSEATCMLEPAAAVREKKIIAEASETIGTRNMASFSAMLGIGENLSPLSREALQAVIATIANVALKNTPYGAEKTLRSHMQLSAISTDGGTLGRAVDSFSLSSLFNDEEDFWGPPSASATHEDLNELEENLDQLNALAGGTTPPETMKYVVAKDVSDEEYDRVDWNKYEDPSGMDRESRDYYRTKWNADSLLRHTINNAETFIREHPDLDVMRFHNSHPEAVNFLLSSQQAAFLMRHDAREQPISDIESFVNSYWMNMVGNVKLTVSPELLAQTRDILRREPIREIVTEAGRF